VKREKLNLGEKVTVICEGGAETAIMEILLEAGRLIFTEEDLFYDEIIRCRSAEIFEQRYLKVRMDFKKSGKKPSEYCKQFFKNENLKSRKWVKEYFRNIKQKNSFLEVNMIKSSVWEIS